MGMVLFGFAAAITTGIILDRTNRYTLALKLSCIGSSIAIVAAYFLLADIQKLWSGLIFSFFGGITIVPIIPICFSLATECTHPLQPALVTGMLMAAAQVFVFGFTYFYLYVFLEGKVV
jgi:MFS family permease